MTSHEEMQKHLGLLFAGCDSGKFINLRAIPPSSGAGTVLEKFFPVTETEAAIEFALGCVDTHNIFVGVAPRDMESGGADAVSQISLIWVDCDTPESVSALSQLPLEPSLVVASGTGDNKHAYFALTSEIDPELAERMNLALAQNLGGDQVCRDRARIMRLAGSRNHKHDPPTPVAIVASPGTRFGIEEITDRLGPLPEAEAAAKPQAARKAAEDPSPVVQNVLAKLDGVAKSGKRWKALCPAHDDHDPSLAVDEGDDGRCLLNCFAGCEFEAIVAALGLTPADLMSTPAKQSVASKLIDLATGRLEELFCSPDGRTWLTVVHDGCRENWPVKSSEAEQWLRRIYFEAHGKGLSREAVAETQSTLDAVARFEGSEHEVFVRVAGDAGSKVFVDIGDADRNVIKIDSSGFEVTKDCPVRFYRSPSSTRLPTPEFDGSVDDLRHFVNVRDEQTMMRLIGFLLMSFHPSGPYPVLNIHGEQGSAKSTVTRIVLDLVDPHKAGLLSGTPKAQDLALVASSNHLIALDNVSRIKQDLSDTICRISTGGGFRTRRLYTDTDEVVLEFCCPMVVNGIGQVIKRPDLLERTAPIELMAIPPESRCPENEIWADWEKARPGILGGLLRAVSVAIKNLNDVNLPALPRLADWARWGEAAAPELGWDPGTFVAAIDAGQEEQVELSIDDHPEIRGLIDYIEKYVEVTCSPTDLMNNIHKFIEAEPNTPGLARQPAQFSRLLSIYEPALRKHGIEFERNRGNGGNRSRDITVRKS